MSEETRFVLLSTQRTGSTWLVSLLDSHPQIRMYGELFHKDSAPLPYGQQDFGRFSEFRDEEKTEAQKRRPFVTARYLSELFGREGAEAVGFKLMYNQLARLPEVVALLRLHRARVLHLIRENLLDVVISREAMLLRGVAHVSEQLPATETQVTLDVIKLQQTLARLELQVAVFRRIARAIDRSPYELSYELLLTDPSRHLARVAAFLGVRQDAAAALSSSLVRATHVPRAARIENYSAVEQSLRGTKYARYLA
jgi:LPS sulfotransferase NodH